jgi:glycosyltransferase involved in cell wall biosynthesis
VARLHPVKDHASLLAAFASVARLRPDVDLLLAGKGPLQEELGRRVGELGISDRVRFLGVRSDVPRLLAASDVFALTSVTEAASLTVMEAMATGIPVVATNVGGNPELIRNEIDGLLFPRGDAPAGAAAMLRVLDDPVLALRLGAAARQQAFERFDLNATIDRYLALYRRLIGRGGAE